MILGLLGATTLRLLRIDNLGLGVCFLGSLFGTICLGLGSILRRTTTLLDLRGLVILFLGSFFFGTCSPRALWCGLLFIIVLIAINSRDFWGRIGLFAFSSGLLFTVRGLFGIPGPVFAFNFALCLGWALSFGFGFGFDSLAIFSGRRFRLLLKENLVIKCHSTPEQTGITGDASFGSFLARGLRACMPLMPGRLNSTSYRNDQYFMMIGSGLPGTYSIPFIVFNVSLYEGGSYLLLHLQRNLIETI